jgi:Zn-dependent protease
MVDYVHYSGPDRSSGPRMFKFGKYSFSTTEILHLSVALFMITLTLMALDVGNVLRFGFFNFVLVYFLSVGLGFLLHELGHKFVAQHYGYISEFRADFFMLVVAFVMAYVMGFVFLAPGAVMILGRLSRKQNGIVSVAGPLVNLALALIFTLIGVVLNPISTTLVWYIVYIGVWVNSFLGIFNMLPFWDLDGKKVLAWNKGVYFIVMLSLVFFLLSALYGWFF